MIFGMVMYVHGTTVLVYHELQPRSQVIDSCENHVLARISEVNRPTGMNFGTAVYNYEWIISAVFSTSSHELECFVPAFPLKTEPLLPHPLPPQSHA